MFVVCIKRNFIIQELLLNIFVYFSVCTIELFCIFFLGNVSQN